LSALQQIDREASVVAYVLNKDVAPAPAQRLTYLVHSNKRSSQTTPQWWKDTDADAAHALMQRLAHL
jgi:hypothetical protein